MSVEKLCDNGEYKHVELSGDDFGKKLKEALKAQKEYLMLVNPQTYQALINKDEE